MNAEIRAKVNEMFYGNRRRFDETAGALEFAIWLAVKWASQINSIHHNRPTIKKVCDQCIELILSDLKDEPPADWVVEFVDCGEAMIRTGTVESVDHPDDLG